MASIDSPLTQIEKKAKTDFSSRSLINEKMGYITLSSMLDPPSASEIYGLGISSDSSVPLETIKTDTPSFSRRNYRLDEFNKENKSADYFSTGAHKYEQILLKLQNLVQEKNFLSVRISDVESNYNQQLQSQSETIEILRKSNDQLSKQLFLTNTPHREELTFTERLRNLELSLETIMLQREKWALELENVRKEMSLCTSIEPSLSLDKKELYNQSNHDLSALEAKNGELIDRIDSLTQKINSMSSSNMKLASSVEDHTSIDLRQDASLPGTIKPGIMRLEDLISNSPDLSMDRQIDPLFQMEQSPGVFSTLSMNNPPIIDQKVYSSLPIKTDRSVQDDSYAIEKGVTLMTELLQLYHQLFNKMEKKEKIIREKLAEADDVSILIQDKRSRTEERASTHRFLVFVIWSICLVVSNLLFNYTLSILDGPSVVPY